MFLDHLSSIDTVIIENQIGPLANKMKTIQGMLSQYFIMKNNYINIDFISSFNKLKDFTKELVKEKDAKLDYKERKKLGIQICNDLIHKENQYNIWIDMFNKHKKKDDLSDCFLQGYWYMNNKLN